MEKSTKNIYFNLFTLSFQTLIAKLKEVIRAQCDLPPTSLLLIFFRTGEGADFFILPPATLRPIFIENCCRQAARSDNGEPTQVETRLLVSLVLVLAVVVECRLPWDGFGISSNFIKITK